ncbi:MAG TPA: NAD(P)-dependent oxidoreductase [Candidatus Cybelea sp.]|nr:NAD(P)-dependent oxidoreductase [Candidatus Cybelea sp.]
MQRVLITGASGGIGRRLRTLFKGVYPKIRLSDRVTPNDLAPHEEFAAAELTDVAALDKAVAGMEGIVHLGGMALENNWDTILQSNIVGTYNVFEAARRHGVKRIVFASSNHAIGFYRRSRRIGTDNKVRPDSRYGVSKAFGEALAALYADKHGIGALCIRIGNFDDRPVDHRRLSIWIHPEDLAALVRIGLEHPALHYDVVYGASANERSWWDNAAAERLGYRPKHRAEDHLAFALAGQAKLPRDPIGELFQGGGFASAEFSGDAERIS